jgi:glycosyltransferase involved in cell wall biosynthesis
MSKMISVVIPTYNEERNIERCLESLKKQTLPRYKYEIIVVDGNSKDRTVELAKKYADKVIQQKSEGVGGARNDGVKIAKSELIATTDADCILPNNWVERIQKIFDDENIIAVYGLLEPIDMIEKLENENKEKKLYSVKLKYKISFIISNLFMILSNYVGYHHLCAANCAFNRESFLKAGGYRPLKYLDDIEIDWRLKKLGKIILDKNLIIGYSVRRFEKIGVKKTFYMFTKNFIKLMLRKEIKVDYDKQNYS